MSKIDYNSSSVNTSIMPKITATIDNLDSLNSCNNSISIPRGFKYTSFLNNYFLDMKEVRKLYFNQKIALENAEKKISRIIEEMNVDLLNLKKIEISNKGESL